MFFHKQIKRFLWSLKLAFTEESCPHVVIHRQVRATENMIWNARRILGDERHGFLAQCSRIGRRILKEGA